MHRDEPIHVVAHRIIRSRMKTQRKPRSSIPGRWAYIPLKDPGMPLARDQKPNDAGLPREFTNGPQAGVRMAERKRQHGLDARLMGENAFREPAIVSDDELSLDGRVGMETDLQHGLRKDN